MPNESLRETAVPSFISFVSLLRDVPERTERQFFFEPSDDEIESALSSVFPAPVATERDEKLVVAA